MLFKRSALKNLANHTGKIPTLESPFNNMQAVRPAALLKRLQHKRRSAKPAKPLRTLLFTEHLRWQLLEKEQVGH